MELSDIEKYKREMMALYGRSTAPEDTPDTQQEVPENSDIQPDMTDDTVDDTAYERGLDEEGEDRYPDPDLSLLDTDLGTLDSRGDTPPEYPTEESIGSANGYIQVYVRTGDESSPVIGASVTVTAIVDGARMMIASGVTDENGTAPRFTVPAPDILHSQAPDPSDRPYSLFDVSVTAEGFFNARSVDVPVFPEVTSVQNFSMIPLPLMMNSSDETVTYYNSEPRF